MDAIRVLVYVSIFVGIFTTAYYLLSFVQRKKISNQKITNWPYVSIVVPAYNEENNLGKTVESLLDLDYAKNKYEIIIVDDGSKDNTLKVARSLEKKYKIIRAFHKENGGKGSALNYGIKRAKGEYIVSFDSDSMVIPSAMKSSLPYFSDPKVMCVTPAMKIYRPRRIFERVQAIEYDLGIFLRKVFSNIDAIHVTPGPFSIYRKGFFEKHGGYDEDNITEDMEIALRIQGLNYKIANSPTSLVYTLAPKKFVSLIKQRRRWYFGLIRNFIKYRKLFGRKYGEMGVIILPLAVLSVLSTMIITLYYIIKGIIDSIRQINFYSYIGFDLINNFQFKMYMISLSLYRIFSEGIVIFGIFFFILTLSMLIIINSKVKSIDKPISTFISYMFFIVLYSIFFTFWWSISIVYSITHRRIEW